MYVAVLAGNLLQRVRPATAVPATMATFAITLAGSVYALYLTWIEVAVIDAICQWCVVSAILTLLLLAVEGTALWRLMTGPLDAQGETTSGQAAS